MVSTRKHFILNRCSDWQNNGSVYNLDFESDLLISKKSQPGSEKGVYLSKAFDSMEKETTWHRLRLDMDLPKNVAFKIKVYSSDSLKVSIPDLRYGDSDDVVLDEYFGDKSISLERKIAVFDSIGGKTYENTSDLLLYSFTGRYLWLCIEIQNYSDEDAKVNKIKIEFPRDSFVDYLPQIYRSKEKDAFLDRFVGVFQSIHQDLNDDIDNVPTLFDPMKVDSEMLKWLSEWFSLGDSFIWGEDKLRVVLKNIMHLYKIKGTKQAIMEIVKIFTGSYPLIIEQFELEDSDYYKSNKEYVKNLFGNNDYIFTVILTKEEINKSDLYAELLRIINKFKPIDAICNLVVLDNKMYLDHHCYLGVNSNVAENQNMILNEDNEMASAVMLADSPNDVD